jgi:hypothetical protein
MHEERRQKSRSNQEYKDQQASLKEQTGGTPKEAWVKAPSNFMLNLKSGPITHQKLLRDLFCNLLQESPSQSRYRKVEILT